MKSDVLGFLFLSAAAFGQNAIPPGTVLAAQLNSSLNSKKSKPGETITARIMQDVPLSSGRKIPAGARVVGQVIGVSPPTSARPAQITFRFDRIQFHHESLPINTNLRALASMMAVADAQVPPTGPDRGTPWAWTTKNLVGGEVAYGEGGPVARGTEIVGRALAEGVLVRLEANQAAGCRGDFAGSTQPQALWVFSSNACGAYGLDDVEITHAGRSAPLGEITLTSKQGNLNINRGAGILLRVNGSDQ